MPGQVAQAGGIGGGVQIGQHLARQGGGELLVVHGAEPMQASPLRQGASKSAPSRFRQLTVSARIHSG